LLVAIVVVSWSSERVHAQKAPAPSLTAASVTGTWETSRYAGFPWIFNLQGNGAAVTGKIWQDGGLTGPVSIIDGRIDGNTLILKYRLLRGANATTITLTGSLKKDELTFTSQVDLPPRGGSEPRQGLLSGNVPRTFSVKRGAAAVWGTTTVQNGLPIPTLEFSLIDGKGKRFQPVLKADNTGQSGAKTLKTLRAFMMRLPAGEYRPVINRLPNGYVLKSIEVNNATLNGAFKITPDAPAPELVINIDVASGRPWVAVQGRVLNVATRVQITTSPFSTPQSTPSPPVRFELTNALFAEPWIAHLGPSGAFEFPQILPGTYQVRFLPGDWINVLKSWPSIVIPSSDRPVQLDLVAPDVQLGCVSC
jgi:hypothetical protein